MIAPVFAKHRYGREDVLAMMPKNTRPPDNLHCCPFFVEQAQRPIILSNLSEAELVSALTILPYNQVSFFSACSKTSTQVKLLAC